MKEVIRINGIAPALAKERIAFENLTPLFPDEKFTLCGDRTTTNLSTRVVDLFSHLLSDQLFYENKSIDRVKFRRCKHRSNLFCCLGTLSLHGIIAS
jgi:hypothetical protein